MKISLLLKRHNSQKNSIFAFLSNNGLQDENISFVTDLIKNSKSLAHPLPHLIVKAGKPKRLFNFWVDFLFVLFFCTIIGNLLSILFKPIFPDFVKYMMSGARWYDLITIFSVGMVYFTTMESLTGKTIGKFLTKTKVTDIHGDKPKFSQILLRSAARFIPFEALSFLFEGFEGLHDAISKTRVMEDK